MNLRLTSLMLMAVFAIPAACPAEGPQGSPRVLVILEQGFNRQEYYMAYLPLVGLGYEVDVAAPQAGAVLLRQDGQPDGEGRDARANLSLDEVDATRYLALVIPGGFSPARLERQPRALEIVREFHEAGKPIAAVCHGPRLLLQAGVLEGRVATGLYQIPNELPQRWADGAYGAWVDREVVIDGNLLTSRYPNDMHVHTRALLSMLEERGGLELPRVDSRVVLVAPGLPGGHSTWVLRDVPRVLGVQVTVVGNADQLAAVADVETIDALALLGGDSPLARSPRVGELSQAVRDAGGRVVELDDAATALRPMVQAALASSARRQAAPSEPKQYTAAIALERGFDERAMAAAEGLLRYHGHEVLIVGHEKGWLRSLNGMPVEVTATYGGDMPLAPGAVIVAPGVLWPRHVEARQAEPAEWTAQQEQRDRARQEWLLARREGGATIAAIGFDAHRLGLSPVFEGKEFASSEQTVWAFPRGAGRYSRDRVRQTDDRLYTAADASAVAELFRLMESQAALGAATATGAATLE